MRFSVTLVLVLLAGALNGVRAEGTGVSPGVEVLSLPVNGLGVALSAASLAPPPVDPASLLGEGLRSPSLLAPLYVRVPVSPVLLQEAASLHRLLEAMASRDLVPILALQPPWGESITGRRAVLDFDLDAWLDDVDRFLARRDRSTLLVQIGEQMSERVEARLHAFLIKRVSVRVKAVRPAAVVATGPISEVADLVELGRLGISPYIDAVTLDAGLPEEALLAARRALPGLSIWIAGAGTGERTYLHEATLALSRAVSLIVAAPGRWPASRDLLAWRRLLDTQAVVVPTNFGRVQAAVPAGEPLAGEDVLEIQSNARGGRFVALFGSAAAGDVELTISGPPVGIAWTVDPISGEERVGGAARRFEPENSSSPRSRVVVHPRRSPTLFRLSQAGAQRALQVAEEVRTDRVLTLPEILARHRRFQAAQSRLFHNLIADARIDYHFSIANLNQTFDVTTHNRYFTDGVTSQYEERDMFINGARWRGKSRPDLPFIVPEKVTEVPLDLRLDDTYAYKLRGLVELGGEPAYLLAFEPVEGKGGAYRGRVWIDAGLFSTRRMEVIETHPALPVISNEIFQTFEPVASGGRDWWLLTRLDGQMVFSALGRNVLLERQIEYTQVVVNAPDHQEQVDMAWASGHPILEDSGGEFRRLEAARGKGREARELRVADSGVSRLLVTGISVGDDFIPSFPFAGVNYFNMDFKGTGTQVDVVWAGPFVSAFWSDPGLGKSKVILGVQTRINPLDRTDRRIDEMDGIEDDVKAERLEISAQQVGAVLGYPLGPYNKFELQGDIEYFDYDAEKQTAPDFVVPGDTAVGSLTLRWVFNRGGYRLEYGLTGSKRDNWEFWGDPDGLDFDPGDDDWTRSILSFNKVFFLRRFDKLSLHLSYMEGNGLDRFSRFNFGESFISSVSGFGGSTIKFDRGLVADLGYSINLGQRARLDMSVDHGIVRNREDFGPDDHTVTGATVSVNFSGPWSSFIRARLGVGLHTSLEDEDGGVSLRLLAFRTFDRWFWQKKGPAILPGDRATVASPEPAKVELPARSTFATGPQK